MDIFSAQGTAPSHLELWYVAGTLSRLRYRQGAIARGLVAALAVIGALCAPSLAFADREDSHHHHQHRRGAPHHNGVIFVHGFEGSGSQFESQKMRLASSGYPDSYVTVFEYNSLEFASALESGSSVQAQEQQLFAEMDQAVAHMKAITHRAKGALRG